MKLPEVENPDKYTGLYVIDFGDHCGVGFTAQEVAELLESEDCKDITVYKIYNAFPDGTMELQGIRKELFQLEAGMFFYSSSLEQAQEEYQKLVNIGNRDTHPCRAKIHLSKIADDKYITSIIYPAEFDKEMSQWLLDEDYRTIGNVQGGIQAVTEFYSKNPEIINRYQLHSRVSFDSRTGSQLIDAVKMAVQR